MGTEFQRIKFNQTNFPQKTNPQNLKTEVSDPKWVALPMEYQPTYWFSLVNKKIGLVGPVIHAMTQFGDLFTRLSKQWDDPPSEDIINELGNRSWDILGIQEIFHVSK